MMLTIAVSSKERLRHCERYEPAWPALNAAQTQLAQQWLSSPAQERKWQSLLDIAGTQRLDMADQLANLLCESGWLILKERREHHQWRTFRIVWCDLPALQAQFGITSQAQKQQGKQTLMEQLNGLAIAHPWLQSACASLTSSRNASALEKRSQLLHALASWQQEQRRGMRQDFSLHSRGHTKSISSLEWDWLLEHVDLQALGIEPFAPVLWIAGCLSLFQPALQSTVDVRTCSFISVPANELSEPLQVHRRPERYWLIENRSSFERQAKQLETGICLIWLPGRPSTSWQKAMQWLLKQAGAPAYISCDPDPAGVDIALTVGNLWTQAQLHWQSHKMALPFWLNGKQLPLNDYDSQLLSRLLAKNDLPYDLRDLCESMQKIHSKAEQEGWL
jgi:hypothetical protein